MQIQWLSHMLFLANLDFITPPNWRSRPYWRLNQEMWYRAFAAMLNIVALRVYTWKCTVLNVVDGAEGIYPSWAHQTYSTIDVDDAQPFCGSPASVYIRQSVHTLWCVFQWPVTTKCWMNISVKFAIFNKVIVLN